MNNQRKTILIVDDDRCTLMALEKRLTSAGFRVLLAASGEDGLQRARGIPVDAALLDVNLPGKLDGLQVARPLHELRETQVPIIFVTGDPGADFGPDCRAVRGRYFVSKPYDGDVLVQLLRGIFAADELAEVQRVSAAKRRQPAC